MGIIDKDNIKSILASTSAELNRMYDKVEILSLYELYLLLVILSQYLYVKYADKGSFDGKYYSIFPSVVKDAIDNKSWASYAFKLITARNVICHEFGTSEMTSYVNRFTNNPKQIKGFLSTLDLVKKQKKRIQEQMMF